MQIFKLSLLILIIPITLFAQWYQQNSGTQSNINSIFFIDSNIGWAAGDQGVILKTTNGGNNWIDLSVSTTDNLYSVYFEDSSVGWIAGDNVRIMKSTDGGSTWFAQTANPPFPIDLHSVQFQDLNNGWAVGHYMYSSNSYDSYTIQTTDGGTTWENNQYFMDEKLYSVFFINNDLGWAAGSEVAGTTDGGSNWTALFGSFLDGLHSVFFINNSTGWVAGRDVLLSKGLIYKSTDGGMNWILLRSDTLKTYTSIFFTDDSNGWVSGSAGNILYTSNGGADWSIQSSPASSNLNSIFFIDNLTGWAAGNNGTILKTTNGGTPVELSSFSAKFDGNNVNLTWTTSTEVNNSGFEVLRAAKKDEWERLGFVTGHGTTTETQHYSFTDNNVNQGNYQYKLKQIDFDGTFEYSKILGIEIPIVNEFQLYQNFPNPFNSTTRIKYSVPQKSQVQVKVFNILGNEIETLVNEEKPAGTYNISWDALNQPSGIYFYRVQAVSAGRQTGNFVQTKKMILLK